MFRIQMLLLGLGSILGSFALNLPLYETDSPFSVSSYVRNQTHSASLANTNLLINVVDSDGNPVPKAKIYVWGVAFTPHPKPADLIDEWVGLGESETDNAGNSSFQLTNVADCGFTNFQIGASDSSDRRLVGAGRANQSNIELGTRIRIVVAESKSFSGRLVDYDSQSPVGSAEVQLFARAKHRVGWMNTGMTAESDADGRFSFTKLIQDGDYRIRVSHPDYHHFEGFELTFSPKYEYFQKEQTLKLLSIEAYDNVIMSARFSLPDTENLTAAQAFEALSKRFDADQVIHKQIVTQQNQLVFQVPAQDIDSIHQFMIRTRVLPIGLYRDAMWKLAGASGSDQTQYSALAWLADSKHAADQAENKRIVKWPPVSQQTRDQEQEYRKVAAELVDRFVKNGALEDDLISFIGTFHNEPKTVLKQILSQHPDRVVQAAAAIELGNQMSYYRPDARATSLVEGVAERQRQERRIWELVVDKYDDVELGSQKIVAGKTARAKLEFLDTYGVGGKAPELTGATMAGETIRLGEYGDKLTVLHFCRNQRLEIYDDLRNLRNRHPDSVRLFGVAYYGNQDAKTLLERHHVDWPVVKDPRPNGLTYQSRRRNFGMPHPLMWGKVDVLGLENFETFVIDNTGTILAVGLRGSQLTSFVAENLNN